MGVVIGINLGQVGARLNGKYRWREFPLVNTRISRPGKYVLYVFVFVIFLFFLVSGVAAVCDCGTPWTFVLTFLKIILNNLSRPGMGHPVNVPYASKIKVIVGHIFETSINVLCFS